MSEHRTPEQRCTCEGKLGTFRHLDDCPMARASLPSKQRTCQHPRLHFGSGDYYLFCRDCDARWVIHNPALPEYEHGPDGNIRVGADSSMCTGYVAIQDRTAPETATRSKDDAANDAGAAFRKRWQREPSDRGDACWIAGYMDGKEDGMRGMEAAPSTEGG